MPPTQRTMPPRAEAKPQTADASPLPSFHLSPPQNTNCVSSCMRFPESRIPLRGEPHLAQPCGRPAEPAFRTSNLRVSPYGVTCETNVPQLAMSVRVSEVVS